ncbi:MAG: class I SAM-dependent methyltransferase [Acidobacteriota bacterium]|nr:class I SAM-dependent methyltransferase [Acidobacteriota bacterium]
MTSYDEVPYPAHAFSQTHPDRLATLARLFGMTPADPRRCRVLELGCGSGGNLLPMAVELPESRFLGIDLAARPVAEGQALIEEVGLKNVALRREDIMEFPADAGLFDYIIAHGVYSWVPAEVRERLLALVGAHLAPRGVAMISYNAYPGGHARNMLREMMLFHVRGIEDPRQRIEQARALLKFLAESQTDEDHYARLLRAEFARVVKYPAEHLYHDDLAEINEHFYFTQFASDAARHGLQYVSEAYYHRTHHRWRPPGAPNPLADLDDTPILREQYGDFVNCCRFRMTLLCRDDVALERAQRPEQMRQFFFTGRIATAGSSDDAATTEGGAPTHDAHATSQTDAESGTRAESDGVAGADPYADVRTDGLREFVGSGGTKIVVGAPIAKAAFTRLGELWPSAASFDELLDFVRALLGRGEEDDTRERDAEDLCLILLTAYASGFLEVGSYKPNFITEVSERPRTTALARAQARRGTHVTNLRHAEVKLEVALTRRLVELLDGTRDRAGLVSELRAFVESGEAFGSEGEADAREVLKSLPEQLEVNLKALAELSLLVS